MRRALLTIEHLRRIAHQRKGKCLSAEYLSAKTALLWECENGHQWKATPDNIRKGTWCPQCAGKSRGATQRLNILTAQMAAERQNGRCLSEQYSNARTKLLWECTNGHQWEAPYFSIKAGSWCPKCARRRIRDSLRSNIREMRRIAEERGGRCLSEVYVSSKSRLLWECSEGHRWETAPQNVKSGTWCPKCLGTPKLTIEEMNRVAKERGGRCLSKEYTDVKTRLLWECAKGHQWEAIPSKIKSGQWCPVCAGVRSLTIGEMHKMARERGGRCLSQGYVNSKSKLLWECSDGHQWEAAPERIKSGRWCPECGFGLGERIRRAFFEQCFSQKFPRARPKWLLNRDGNHMELDGYCDAMRLGFEHHGQQHYGINTPFVRSKADLSKRMYDDLLKRTLCEEHGIVLIEIPEIGSLMEVDELKVFIKRECIKNGIRVPSGFDLMPINLEKAYATSIREELRSLAESRGGKCLIKEYLGANKQIEWQCSEGHRWKATPAKIKSGQWCPKCGYKRSADLRRSSTQEMQQVAASRGGRCLSSEYRGTHFHLLWECSKGHRWEATPSSVRSGAWCPRCARVVKLTIEEMRQIAEARGGRCLSEEYLNSQNKLRWECSEGHRWTAIPNNIRKGQWCPQCAGNVRFTIQKMREIAQERGGKCLSQEYVNCETRLLWECSEGHRWEAAFSGAKETWCPSCKGVVNRISIDEMRRIAEARGGRCLSAKYVNSSRKLQWKCSEGHEWEARPDKIKRGQWCPRCARKQRGDRLRSDIEEMRNIAKRRGGECLSTIYLGNHSNLLWECSRGHQWSARPSNIKTGRWCPKCAGTAKLTIEEMREMAKKHAGICISQEYINSDTKLLWECFEGHRWEARPDKIKRGQWCPKCARNGRKTRSTS